MAETEKHLARFYRELQAWIDGGMGRHGVFDQTDSICLLALEWGHAHRIDTDAFMTAIGDSFEAAGLSREYPFNSGFYSWWREDEPYLNPARLAWIKEHAIPDGAERVHSPDASQVPGMPPQNGIARPVSYPKGESA